MMDLPNATAPVLHLNEAGEHDPSNGLASPCVDVLYSFALDMARAGKAEGRTYALIDTGSDVSVIDRRLVPPHAQFERDMPSIDIIGMGICSVYLVECSFVGSSRSFTTQVVAGTVGGTRPYSMIIGRSLLQATRFVYDRGAGIQTLEIF